DDDYFFGRRTDTEDGKASQRKASDCQRALCDKFAAIDRHAVSTICVSRWIRQSLLSNSGSYARRRKRFPYHSLTRMVLTSYLALNLTVVVLAVAAPAPASDSAKALVEATAFRPL